MTAARLAALEARVASLEMALTTLTLRIGDLFADRERRARELAEEAGALAVIVETALPAKTYQTAFDAWSDAGLRAVHPAYTAEVRP